MSGVFGLFNQDGKPVERGELGAMASLLERRGPDRTEFWNEGPVGLGLTLLTTTPELAFERQPVRHGQSGCVIVADVRLDNREELLAALGLADRLQILGDAGLILEAYLAWGEACLDRFLGDFAFMLWDPRHQKLFGARDHFGMRPFYYHHTPGRFFAFASEPKAILVLPQTPSRINEGRIADFLTDLEDIDKTSTFFEELFRLPPAHCVSVTAEHKTIRHYWNLESGEELRMPTDEAYAEAFLEVFSESVRCRLRSHGPVGSMLSGGMDSGSVVAVAKEILAEQGRGPLPTFSAVGPDPATCVETRTIHAAMTMDGLDPTLIRYDQLQQMMPDLGSLTRTIDEPFDHHMTLPRAVYLAAQQRGVKVVLDGVAGDIVLSAGSHIVRLIRSGRWRSAYREAVGQEHFWGNDYPAWRELYLSGRSALVPPHAKRLWHQLMTPLRQRQRLQRICGQSMLNPQFAERIQLGERSRNQSGPAAAPLSCGQERARAINTATLVVGRERYDRVASAVAVEPRDPFLDQRVVALCLALPSDQKLHGGWPKVILRRAMASRLPDAVCWRKGKQHLGWSFTRALAAISTELPGTTKQVCTQIMASYLNADGAAFLGHTGPYGLEDEHQLEKVLEWRCLAEWLSNHQSTRKI